jgi:hypothetical protein
MQRWRGPGSCDLARTIVKDCSARNSFGVAGGLSPILPAGTCVVGSPIRFGHVLPSDLRVFARAG